MRKLSPRELYWWALQKWGEDAQIGMFIEEIGEVLTALNKIRRKHNSCTEAELVEELADLQIMLDQMKVVFTDDETFSNEMERKLERLEKMLEG